MTLMYRLARRKILIFIGKFALVWTEVMEFLRLQMSKPFSNRRNKLYAVVANWLKYQFVHGNTLKGHHE